MAKSVRRKIVYVLSREHYHFPPNDSDMVAATPIEVQAGTDTGRINLKVKTKKLAQEQCSKFGGEVKEHTAHIEHRVWLDSPNQNADKFVYVVREVEYVG